ncbi:energy transducer TonB [Hymenobacter sp. PAMC 26628]|uniref:energy transducer TonB n=1 Tax=Hymenobacter sp. PAMC 26628 TaxID=1484118 RepID=UPI000770167F|nr:energy transducer TonB [Hymenobacter sp. PAMC 26628]AMJ67226.1 hypothetical protein AXW84_18655 [Hymenobacter sp. PAMC 26628]
MKNLFTGAVAAILLLAAAPLAYAQTVVPEAAYTGPRFPGGPDSLRALVARATRLAGPAPAGRVALVFELGNGQMPFAFQLAPPPKPTDPALTKAATAVLNYLDAKMPDWQAGPVAPKAGAGRAPKTILALDFATGQAALPYAYADQNPVFSVPEMGQSRAKPRVAYSAWDLLGLIQRQTRYPRNAQNNNEQGVVYLYFEVAETGAIERPEVVGTASPSLDEEALRVVKLLPPATSPALLRGQPVRVYYVLPVTFRIQ